jgi:hemolysin III
MKMQEVILPNYSNTEDKINSVSHMIGIPFGVAALILCVRRSMESGSRWSIISSVIYGFSIIVLFSGSAIYHFAKPGKTKKVLRIIDHCMIFLLIAGSVTPFALVAMRPAHPLACWLSLAVAWGAALFGITGTSINHEKFKKVQMVLYIGVGWILLLGIKTLLAVFSDEFRPGLYLLLIGGAFYTVGAILYGVGKKLPYFHATFHIFVLAGTFIHFISVYNYVLKM